MVWPYGMENWCNMEGRYLHMVAGLKEAFEVPGGDSTFGLC